jgi:hypothetical protein
MRLLLIILIVLLLVGVPGGWRYGGRTLEVASVYHSHSHHLGFNGPHLREEGPNCPLVLASWHRASGVGSGSSEVKGGKPCHATNSSVRSARRRSS